MGKNFIDSHRFYAHDEPMRRSGWLILPAVALGVTVLAMVLTPNPSGLGTHRALGLPPCLFLTLTGWLCPSCGLTTSFTHFAHGHWWAAFQAHPLGPLFYFLLIGLALCSLLEFFKVSTPLGKFLKGHYASWIYGGLARYLLTWCGRLVWTSSI